MTNTNYNKIYRLQNNEREVKMYRGFRLDFGIDDKKYYEIGCRIYNDFKNKVNVQLYDLTDNGVIDGAKLESNWFPQINADVFLSHSHKNEKQAITFAGWLKDKFKLTTFIDSCIWGYSNDLLKDVDNIYCKLSKSSSYSYNRRNQSTSHIHMILNCALLKMIDNTECIFFLDTAEAVTTKTVFDEDRTYSPWLYSELLMTKLVRKMEREVHRSTQIKKSKSLNEDLIISYDIDLDHMDKISVNILDRWLLNYENLERTHNSRYFEDIKYPLNILYNIVPINENKLLKEY